ncbi:MAG: hypothetical protein GC159_15810 [Phycisphaera sp.]|nr:hypothetical protein [Phycisphaera sp.]
MSTTTPTIPTPPSDERKALRDEFAALQHRLLRRIDDLRRRVRVWLLVEGVGRWVMALFGVAMLSFVLDYTLRLGVGARAICGVVFVATLAYLLARWIVGPMRVRFEALDLVHVIDRDRDGRGVRGGDITRKVATILQLPAMVDSPAHPDSGMIREAVRRCDEDLRGVDFTSRIEPTGPVVTLSGAGVALIMAAVACTLAWSNATLWAQRWFALSEKPWPQNTYLAVDALGDDGRLIVPRGEPYTLRVTTDDRTLVQPEVINLTFVNERGDAETVSMTRFDERDFRYDFPPIGAPLRVTLRGGDDRFGPFTIEPVDRPRVTNLRLYATSPGQAEVLHRFDTGDTDVAFLLKTKLRVEFDTDMPVLPPRLVTLSGPGPDPASLKPAATDADADGQAPHKAFVIEPWSHEGATQLQIELVDAEHGLASHPVPLAIGLKPDHEPRVTIRYAGVRQRITPIASVPLSVLARDDYGLTGLDLRIHAEPPVKPEKPVADPDPIKLFPLPGDSDATDTDKTNVQRARLLDVSSLKLMPGTLMYVHAEGVDEAYAGHDAAVGKSRQLAFRIVTPEELFHEIKLRLQKDRSDFRTALADAEKVAERIGFMKRPEDALAAARTHRLIQRTVWRIHTNMDNTLTEMRYNRLGSDEARQLMQRNIISPMARLHDELMNDQRRDLEQLQQTFDARQLPAIGERQGRIIAEMNRILSQMRQWDSFVDILNQLNEVIDQSTDVRAKAELLTKKQIESLFDN